MLPFVSGKGKGVVNRICLCMVSLEIHMRYSHSAVSRVNSRVAGIQELSDFAKTFWICEFLTIGIYLYSKYIQLKKRKHLSDHIKRNVIITILYRP